MRVNLWDFVRTGHFGDIKLDMLRQEVREILGEPTHIWDRKWNSHWSYGYITFFFFPENRADNGLYWIHCDQIFSPLYDGGNFVLEESIITSKLTLSDTETKLGDANITYKKCEYDSGNNQKCYTLVLESGVDLSFYPRYADTFALTVFSFKKPGTPI